MSLQQDQASVAIVTGAAGGMGSAAAALFAAEKRSLILCDIDARKLTECARSLAPQTAAVEILAGDLGDPAYLQRLLEMLGDRSVAALLHTAGLSPTMGDAKRMFAINFDATVRLVDAMRPKMAVGGCAVLIASTSGYLMKSTDIDAALDQWTPGRDMTELFKIASDSGRAYAISKRAVIRFVAREAAAFGARGARIVSISPGLIDTAMGRAEMNVSQQMSSMLAKTPLRRLGLAEEIASVAVFLCSQGASYVSGCDIPVDGGMLAAMRAL
jgi:NAD(P)-dependent dehydrogenase (short-subunit alcohol dehydrogenase family)